MGEGSLEGADLDEWNITKADMTKCRKCTAMRPEVSIPPRRRVEYKADVSVSSPNGESASLAYLWLSTVLFVLLGYPLFFEALGLRVELCEESRVESGEMFGNGYDLGPLYTLLLSLRILPYTDGRAWARRRWSESESDSVFRPKQNDGGEGEGEVANGHGNGDGRPRQGGRAQMSAHRGVRRGEELTDEE
ncbi:hypothetical protein D9758_018597 [Tetrapyrgos nigripes]|uniref:Uncharacterized protein n=1 Tax=Tetrapyrgos nigripes TaxID=182062 RepID=A0A8H5FC16_9AGAR|nr:hypothetical protein D9758_018597 [Tetrapyrgos nigripes]